MVLVDAGDNFGGISEPDKRKAEVILRSIGTMGYDALGIGEVELNYGTEWLLDTAREAKVPLVCANLINYRTGKPLVQPYVMLKRGKIKVAVMGLLDDVLELAHPKQNSDSLIIEDPMKVAHELIPVLKKKADVVVLLAHMGYAKSSRLAMEIPELDVLVTGHNPSVNMEARKEGNSLGMMTGTRGQYVGYLLLRMSGKKAIETYESKLIPLDGRIRLSSLVERFVNEYNGQEKKLQEERSRRDKEETLSHAGENRYLGQESCKRCHAQTFEKVAQMGHSRAYAGLAKTNSEGLSECLACHTTGFGQPTGFTSASASPDLKDVQCESCHGMGTGHKRDGSYSQVSEKTCLVCHTKEQSPEFDFKTYLRKIAH
jgi:2',3'-cyclic-nucleotide 2'-phosphodiesterase (5'-nucleotidase family)